MMTLNETYEKELQIPVYYADIDKNVVLTSAETDTLRLVVSDKGYVLTNYLYGDARRPLRVSFKNYARNGKGIVPVADLQKMAASQLNASTRIVSAKPDRLVFYYNRGEKKRVPVKWRGTVIPDNLYYLANVVYEPDSVTIYAPREKLDSISVVYTERLSFVDFNDTLTTETPLLRMSGVKMVPDRVTVHFMTDILTEESIDGIPIVGINMPAGKVLRTFPGKVKVKFVAGMKTYRKLSASDFVVVADYREFSRSESPKCAIALQKVPNGISRAKLEVTQVDYLIEEQTP